MGNLAKIVLLVLSFGSIIVTGNKIGAIEDRVKNGEDIDITSVPYHIAIETRHNRYRCGASIISQTFALTAAHCVETLNLKCAKLSIRTKSSLSEEGGVSISVKNVFVHPKYVHKPPHDYDIAIMELDNPVCFDGKSQPINLTDTEPSDGDIVEITGWGRSKPGVAHYPKKLQAVNATVLDRQYCQEINSDECFYDTPRMFCIEAKYGGACDGDSGSPITLSRKKQVGIVSWGDEDCFTSGPNRATNIAHPEIRNFIYNITGI